MNNTLDIHGHLVERCKSNERLAQEEIYKLYSGQMFNVSLRILNSREEAEDVLQEAFIDMFKKVNSFKGESTFGAWFKRIVVNKSINALKKQRSYSQPNDEIPDDSEENEEEHTYTVEHIKEAMQELKPGFRAVFSLYMFEDYSHSEIAQELGISVGTSKSQLSRAKQRVKELVTQNRKVS